MPAVDYDALAREHGGTASGGYAGMLSPGNIDLTNRPRVRNEDGSISTVRSIGVNIGGHEYLLPTVSDDGRIMSDDEAIRTFQRSGKHLGMFDTPEHSTAYAQSLHSDQAQAIGEGVDFGALASAHGGQEVPSAQPVTGERELINYRGLRIARGPDGVQVNPTPTPEEEADLRRKSLFWGTTVAGGMAAGASPAVGAAVGAGLNLAQGNVGGAVVDIGLGMLPGGVLAKMGGKALLARVAHKLLRAEKVAEEAAPAVGRAYQGIPSLMKIGAEGAQGATDAAAAARGAEQASNILKMPYRLPAQSASTVAETAAETATKAATQTAKRAPRAVAKRAKETLALDETPSALESQLRASTLPKEQLAREIEAKVLSLKLGAGKGLSNAQLGTALDELYGVGATHGEQMAEMILKAHGMVK